MAAQKAFVCGRRDVRARIGATEVLVRFPLGVGRRVLLGVFCFKKILAAPPTREEHDGGKVCDFLKSGTCGSPNEDSCGPSGSCRPPIFF